MSNIIYIIQCDNNDYFKAGMSTNIESRIKTYKCSHWIVKTLRLYSVPYSLKLRDVEKALFSLLETICICRKSEMFKFNQQELETILDKCDMFVNNYIKEKSKEETKEEEENGDESKEEDVDEVD